MSRQYTTLYTQTQLTNAPGQQTLPVGGAKGLTVRNLSPYWFVVLDAPTAEYPLEYLEPWSITTMPLTDCPSTLYVNAAPEMGTVPTTVPQYNQNQSVAYKLTYGATPAYQRELVISNYAMLYQDPTSGQWVPYQSQVSGSVDATISQTVATDLGVGMTRDLAGGVYYAQNTGILTVTFQHVVQQVYLQNQAASGQVTVTGDEDPSMSSAGLVLNPGDALGISWRTQHVYLKGSAAQLPVQCQGWY